MKKLLYMVSVAVLTLVTSCGDNFLDTQNKYAKDLQTFYQTPQDIEEAMAGIYNAMYTPDVFSMEGISANLLSDMVLGGGGPDDRAAKNLDGFQDPEEDTFHDLWVYSYRGIYRINTLIEKVTEADLSESFSSEEDAQEYKNQTLGEAYFMRAFFYFKMAKFFGGLPLILKTDDPKDVARSTFTETFSQIASDLKTAIELLPTTAIQGIPVSQYGHANKWVAEGYMARIYLFYTGYMTNIEGQATSEIPLPEGGSITKDNAIGYLEDIMQNSGHALVEDYRNIWPYSYINESAGEVVLPWAEEEDLMWAGQDGPNGTRFGTGNQETMFAERYAFGDWDYGQQFNNRMPLFFGIRDNQMVPFGQGWGWGTINPVLYRNWDDNDTRKRGSILEMDRDDQGTGGYQQDKGDHETGYFNKKYTTLQHAGEDEEDGIQGMFYFMYEWNHGDPFQLWAAQDYILMRYADVLLMHSELTETATGMNEVRVRAGLEPVGGYSLEAIKQERMYEFVFEGLRWFDLVRWGDVESAFNFDVAVRNSGIESRYSVQYRPEIKGLMPIPETEIRLSNGVYNQNPGWETN